jgi:hypothetical protein
MVSSNVGGTGYGVKGGKWFLVLSIRCRGLGTIKKPQVAVRRNKGEAKNGQVKVAALKRGGIPISPNLSSDLESAKYSQSLVKMLEIPKA